MRVICNRCDGKRAEPGTTYSQCTTCNGTGEVGYMYGVIMHVSLFHCLARLPVNWFDIYQQGPLDFATTTRLGASMIFQFQTCDVSVTLALHVGFRYMYCREGSLHDQQDVRCNNMNSAIKNCKVVRILNLVLMLKSNIPYQLQGQGIVQLYKKVRLLVSPRQTK